MGPNSDRHPQNTWALALTYSRGILARLSPTRIKGPFHVKCTFYKIQLPAFLVGHIGDIK